MGYLASVTPIAHHAPVSFELDGGSLCLDFANTWGHHGDPGSDRLRRYEDLVAFFRQTERLTSGEEDLLIRAAARNPNGAAAAMRVARDVRELIYRVMSTRAAESEVRVVDIKRINTWLATALSRRVIEPRGDDFAWGWVEVSADDLRGPIWAAVDSAASLITSDDFDRVRECAAGDCNWLFLDRSRGRTRRWCSMKSCGNRAKARRHYRRRRKG